MTDACRAPAGFTASAQGASARVTRQRSLGPSSPLGMGVACSEWASLGAGAPSGGCFPYSHLGPLEGFQAPFARRPLPLQEKGERGWGWGENVCFPHSLLCFLPDLGEGGVTRSGDRRRLWEVRGLAG